MGRAAATEVPPEPGRAQMADSRRERTRRGRGGFTLLEALISLIIFTLITVALALALNAASQTYGHANKAQAQSGEVRAIFGSLTRDIQAAYASNQNPVSQFVSGGAASGSAGSATRGSSDGLLTLTTLTNRIDAPELDAPDGSSAPASAGAAADTTGNPQSDCALVRYDFDPNTQTLLRTTSPIPNEQILSSRPPGPELTLSKHIQSLTLRFWVRRKKTGGHRGRFFPPKATKKIPTGRQAQAGRVGRPDRRARADRPQTRRREAAGRPPTEPIPACRARWRSRSFCNRRTAIRRPTPRQLPS